MKKRNQQLSGAAIGILTAFILWTVCVRVIDVQAIGPQDSSVGFAALNTFIHSLTGVHWTLYTVTDWLSPVPFGFAAGFAVYGLVQWMIRKRIQKVDADLLVLGGFYMVVAAVYVFFEIVVINYRPVLIDGVLEASYPSSTTLLVLCVMPTAILQLRDRLQNGILRRGVAAVLATFTAFMVIGRLLSGVHWFTDIVGGVMLSTALVLLYIVACRVARSKAT